MTPQLPWCPPCSLCRSVIPVAAGPLICSPVVCTGRRPPCTLRPDGNFRSGNTFVLCAFPRPERSTTTLHVRYASGAARCSQRARRCTCKVSGQMLTSTHSGLGVKLVIVLLGVGTVTHTETRTHRHTHIHGHTQSHRHTQTQIHTDTHRHTYTHRERHTHMDCGLYSAASPLRA